MEYFRLLFALVVPWLGGFFWLQAAESRTHKVVAPNILRQLAYGFFLGYAGLHGTLLATALLFGQVRFWPVATILFTITACGAIAAYRKTTPPSPSTSIKDSWSTLPPAGRLALALLIFWIIIHLSLVAIELLYRPVFPWDAWLNWIYRAKAWFFQGAILPFSSPAEWATAPAGPTYNVAGNHYPTFVPTIALWTASALGYWSETLVNLPVLLCGIALVMGVYGQCREMGGNYLESVIPAYLLVSIPLVGTHLALGGLADIWIAGFTGLGFVALLRGLIDNSHLQVVLGLLMAALAITTKIEGLVWFLAAIATFLLVTRPKLIFKVATVVLVLGLIAWLTGTTYAVLPGGELVGYVDGAVHIPFKGSYPLMRFDILDDYLLNFFARGSWNLLWSLLPLSLPLLFLVKRPKIARPLCYFYLVYIATQIIIFGFTEQGRWAEDGTAINRLPLHFVPALVFCLMLPAIKLRLQSGIERYNNEARRSAIGRGPVIPPLAAFALVASGLAVYVAVTLPPDQGNPRLFKPENMTIAVGGGHIENGTGFINSFQNGFAIVSSGTIDLAANTLELLQVEAGGERSVKTRFFWRLADAPADIESLPLEISGTESIDLSAIPAWKGNITELGLIFYEDDDSSALFRQISLLPRTITSSLHSLWRQWTQLERWSQSSANWTTGGGPTPIVPLPVLVLAWLVLMIILCLVFMRTSPARLPRLLAYSLLAWMVLDIRWTGNLLSQASATIASSPANNTISYIDAGKDEQVAAFIQSARERIPEPLANIVLYGEKKELEFQLLRAKYHLLPHAAYVHVGDIGSIVGTAINYVLVINAISLDPNRKDSARAAHKALLRDKFGDNLAVVLENDFGTLYKTRADD